MKKQLLVTIAALSLCLNACGVPEENGEAVSSQEENTNSENKESENTEVAGSTETPAPEVKETKTTIEEQVVYDGDGVTITATGMDFEGSYMGCEIQFLIENNTEKNLVVQARNVSANGYMIESMMSSDVVAGKKTKDSLTLLKSSIDECDIQDIANVEFSFHIFNDDSWEDSIDTEMISLETSCAGSYVQTYDDSGNVIYEDDYIKIVSKGRTDESTFGTGIKLYMENKTNENITVQARDTSADGFMVDTVFSEEIVAGKRVISSLVLMESEGEELNPESVETSFHIFKTDGWDTLVDTEPITIDLKQ